MSPPFYFPNALSNDGHSPLMLAVEVNDIAIVDTLLDYGARCDPVDRKGWTLLHYVAAFAESAVIERLMFVRESLRASNSLQLSPTSVT
jgi:ankyrin repeat protein